MLPEYSLPVGGTGESPVRRMAPTWGWGWGTRAQGGWLAVGEWHGEGQVKPAQGPHSLEAPSIPQGAAQSGVIWGSALFSRHWRCCPDTQKHHGPQRSPRRQTLLLTHLTDKETEPVGPAEAHAAGGPGRVWKLCWGWRARVHPCFHGCPDRPHKALCQGASSADLRTR